MGPAQRIAGGVSSLRARRRRRSEDRFAERFATQFAQQWSQVRADRRASEPPEIQAGASNFNRAQVPWGVDVAAAWSWRFLVMVGAGYVLLWLLARFAVVTIPLVVALLIAALASPLVDLGDRVGLNRKLSSLLVVIGGLALVSLLLTFVGTQVARGASELADQVVIGLGEIRTWLREGPLNASDSQINEYIAATQDLVTSGNDEVVARVTEVGTTIGHIVAGFFIVLFATYFFLADGARIWAWLVRLFPRAARMRTNTSGQVAWKSLTQFVRATVLVALVDAAGIMIVAAILDVPFVTAIGVLVFLGAFIPMIGATLSGSVAVLVALVEHGWIVALLMVAGVILVQQIEAHVLQPFLLGRFVSVHPLGVIVAIGCGVLVAGIAGALIAVPLVAALNAVAQHLSDYPGGSEESGTEVVQVAEGAAGS
ncbi:MAG: FIG01121868: Possible membrane protein, Rv0205 [uncultured Nocardioidaceae bacterium]|uniref:FIG01121868: Possible membrane protein, Rv0205 n=1 Tax=uncultured Nocardioidaceae bacterium TaxID=253824 RepID=A0A6J4M3G4_9ACTN|nr:MAG: FIG01121868: Possible membrane protein, Rv0205 [uncultured Nocardioidaceae bacterium]